MGMSNKICNGCGVDLIEGDTIPKSRLFGGHVKCRECFNQCRKVMLRNNTKRRSGRYPSGVYGIFRNHELVYVGESSQMWKRIYCTHFKYSTQSTDSFKYSSVHSEVTRDNIDEWSWAYLAKEENLTTRLVIEAQYISRHAPRLNSPYSGLKPNELKSFKVVLEQCDLGDYTLEDLDYQTADKNKVVPDGVYIKRIVKY